MRILLLCDDFHHPGQVAVDGAALLEKQGFQFDVIRDVTNFNPDIFSDYPVILMCKCDHVSQQDQTSWQTETVQQAFVDYVEKGGGLLAVHTALVAGENAGRLERLIGCRFAFHPHECPVTVQPVKPHPITEGVGMFCETDEHYRLAFSASDMDIIMASYSPPQGDAEKYDTAPYDNTPAWISPCGYVRTQGKGRICVLTPGHFLAVWQNPHYQRTLANALYWCAGQK